MVGDGMFGRHCKGSGETCRVCSASPAGVRARIVSMWCEQREFRIAQTGAREGGQEGGNVKDRSEQGSTDSAAKAKQGAEITTSGAGWSWIEAWIWLERMLSALVTVSKVNFADAGWSHVTRLAISETVSMKKPPTGEPYAGKPPVRFGGRGRRKPIPTPIERWGWVRINAAILRSGGGDCAGWEQLREFAPPLAR